MGRLRATLVAITLAWGVAACSAPSGPAVEPYRDDGSGTLWAGWPTDTGAPAGDLAEGEWSMPVSYGNVFLTNQTDEEVVLVRAELDRADPGIEVLGIRALTLVEAVADLTVGVLDEFPVEGYRRGRSVEGTVLAPVGPDQVSTELIIGLRTTDPKARFEGVRVVYRVDGDERETTVPAAFHFCPGTMCAPL